MDNKKKTGIVVLIVLFIFMVFLYSGFFNFDIPSIRDYKGWLPGLIALAALLDSVNPCAFSVLFLTIAFLFSLGKNRKSILKGGLTYICGIFLTYILIGLGILKVLTLFGTPKIVSKFGAIAIISFGLIEFLEQIFPNFPIKLKIPKFAHGKIASLVEKATIPATIALGVLVGLVEFPCTGGPYLFILGLLHDHSSYWTGIGYLFFYNVIFILPLVIALFIAANKKVLEAMDEVRRVETKKAKIWLSIIMIVLGALIFVI